MFVYAIAELSPSRRIKIGYSDDPVKRLSTLQTGSSFPLEFVRVARCLTTERAAELEGLLHQELARFRCKGGGTEWFTKNIRRYICWHKCRRETPDKPACSAFSKQGFGGKHVDILRGLQHILGYKMSDPRTIKLKQGLVVDEFLGKTTEERSNNFKKACNDLCLRIEERDGGKHLRAISSFVEQSIDYFPQGSKWIVVGEQAKSCNDGKSLLLVLRSLSEYPDALPLSAIYA